jgi:hypothetical protein
MSNRIICATANDIERFWMRVSKNGPVPARSPELGNCWVWTGTLLKPWLYGQFCVGSSRFLVHRLSWFIDTGDQPTGQINHKCDNPSCVRPSHLYDGTQLDNMRDAASRVRFHSSGNHCRAKITPGVVRDIRKRRDGGETLQGIGASYGITKQNVRLIVNRLAWKHVE